MVFSPTDDATEMAYGTTWGTIRIGHNPSKQFVDFKAFVKTFQDSIDGGWKVSSNNSQQTIVRARQSVPKRTISIDFSVPSYDMEEALDNLMKCSFLYQAAYPSIKVNGATNQIASSFWTLKWANLISNPDGSGLLGFCEGFTFIPNLEEGNWVTNSQPQGLFQGNPAGSAIVPKLIDIKLKFVPYVLLTSHGFMYNNQPPPGSTSPHGTAAWANTRYPYQMSFPQTSVVPGAPPSDPTPIGPSSNLLSGRLNRILRGGGT